MRIAIITLPLHTNYGGILQAYALQKTLESMGHTISLLEPTKPRMHRRSLMPFVYLKRFIRKFFLKQDVEVFRTVPERIQQFTLPFIEKYIHRIFIKDWIDELADDFDAFVVGSDQVWRPIYNEHLNYAFLSFLNQRKVCRIAYAVSFGTDTKEYSSEQIKYSKPLVSLFDAISVRESGGIEMCKDYFSICPVQVLDPTLLLPKEHYISLFDSKRLLSTNKGNLLLYILDEDEIKDSFINAFINRFSYKPFRVNSKVEQSEAPINERIQPSVESWLKGFNDAEYVITDSYHACVFSILFHVPFIALGNNKRGLSRFSSLLNLFNLENCLIDPQNCFFSPYKFDWNDIDRKLDKYRKQSLEFLSENLKNIR